MLTIFTIPKAFKNQFETIQQNAILSWLNAMPKCEVILFGDDFGVGEFAKKNKIKHIAQIKTNDFKTPILSDVFEKAPKIAKNPILAYVNADIVFTSDIRDVLKRINFKKFLISGRRWDLVINHNIDFHSEWQNDLMTRIKKRGKLGQAGALDYFIFPKSVNFNMPPFAVGRGVWDNWLIYKTKLLKIPTIDATDVITAIHQKHDYSHAGGYEAAWFGPERIRNLELAKDKKRPFNLQNADWILTPSGLKKPQLSIFISWRNLQTLPVTSPKLAIFFWLPVLLVELLIKIYQKLKNTISRY